MIAVTAQAERRQIVKTLRVIAEQLLIEAMNRNQYVLETAETIASILEETATGIERGEHWEPGPEIVE